MTGRCRPSMMNSCSLGLSDHEVLFFQHFWRTNEFVMVVDTRDGLLAARCMNVSSVSIPRRNPWGFSNCIYACEVREGGDGNSALWIHLQCGDEALIEMEGPLTKTFRSDIIAEVGWCNAQLWLQDPPKYLLAAAAELLKFEATSSGASHTQS
jgi:hypothetical protein